MIIKTWLCLNKHCLNQFDSSDGEFPPCVRCGGIKVKWVPKPFGIKSERTKQADRDVRGLQEAYGDRDYRSPRRGESAAPRTNPVPIQGKTQRFTPMAGWSADVPIDQSGNMVPYCAPTGVTAKIAPAIGSRAPVVRMDGRQLGVGGKFEAVHRPAGGIPR